MTRQVLAVCALDQMHQVLMDTSASHLVSLINEQMMPETPSLIAPENHLKLSMNALKAPYQVCYAFDHAFNFVQQWDRSRANEYPVQPLPPISPFAC